VSSEEVGEFEASEISEIVGRILRDLGNPEPPLSLQDVRELLKINLKYYSSTEPSVTQELMHKAALIWNKDVKGVLRHLSSAIHKTKFSAFWSPANRNILIDKEVPDAKHRWIEAHEITHSFTSWHADYLLGDTLQTLDPACHALIEGEANYGAGRLLFLQDRFAQEARDTDLSFNKIKFFADRYGNTIQSTLWRMVEERNPGIPMFGMVSIHPRYPEIGKHDGPDPWRYFIRSLGFRNQFGNVTPGQAYLLIKRKAGWKKRGPIFDGAGFLVDQNGDRREFRIESFSNSHALLSYGVLL